MKKDKAMKEAKKVRCKWFTIRLNEDEESKINNLYNARPQMDFANMQEMFYLKSR